jgi:hypothetical protein
MYREFFLFPSLYITTKGPRRSSLYIGVRRVDIGHGRTRPHTMVTDQCNQVGMVRDPSLPRYTHHGHGSCETLHINFF